MTDKVLKTRELEVQIKANFIRELEVQIAELRDALAAARRALLAREQTNE